jgi:hypothetical protein
MPIRIVGSQWILVVCTRLSCTLAEDPGLRQLLVFNSSNRVRMRAYGSHEVDVDAPARLHITIVIPDRRGSSICGIVWMRRR